MLNNHNLTGFYAVLQFLVDILVQ